ncbi:hypothetical protein AC578_10035 [Pseudocercospora eumusae]|uniref:Uncharacterized protein n=1 Tax=Pseudocercospora eumusae TaxID=321146 RepID=A0A139H6K3_9PEZI|nr:hypothetical protein AC578_10035 [Pseudocercospora eumusae]
MMVAVRMAGSFLLILMATFTSSCSMAWIALIWILSYFTNARIVYIAAGVVLMVANDSAPENIAIHARRALNLWLWLALVSLVPTFMAPLTLTILLTAMLWMWVQLPAAWRRAPGMWRYLIVSGLAVALYFFASDLLAWTEEAFIVQPLTYIADDGSAAHPDLIDVCPDFGQGDLRAFDLEPFHSAYPTSTDDSGAAALYLTYQALLAVPPPSLEAMLLHVHTMIHTISAGRPTSLPAGKAIEPLLDHVRHEGLSSQTPPDRDTNDIVTTNLRALHALFYAVAITLIRWQDTTLQILDTLHDHANLLFDMYESLPTHLPEPLDNAFSMPCTPLQYTGSMFHHYQLINIWRSWRCWLLSPTATSWTSPHLVRRLTNNEAYRIRHHALPDLHSFLDRMSMSNSSTDNAASFATSLWKSMMPWSADVVSSSSPEKYLLIKLPEQPEQGTTKDEHDLITRQQQILGITDADATRFNRLLRLVYEDMYNQFGIAPTSHSPLSRGIVTFRMAHGKEEDDEQQQQQSATLLFPWQGRIPVAIDTFMNKSFFGPGCRYHRTDTTTSSSSTLCPVQCITTLLQHPVRGFRVTRGWKDGETRRIVLEARGRANVARQMWRVKRLGGGEGR